VFPVGREPGGTSWEPPVRPRQDTMPHEASASRSRFARGLPSRRFAGASPRLPRGGRRVPREHRLRPFAPSEASRNQPTTLQIVEGDRRGWGIRAQSMREVPKSERAFASRRSARVRVKGSPVASDTFRRQSPSRVHDEPDDQRPSSVDVFLASLVHLPTAWATRTPVRRPHLTLDRRYSTAGWPTNLV
jgi:hypothetical protein